jgi:hypothetical protein
MDDVHRSIDGQRIYDPAYGEPRSTPKSLTQEADYWRLRAEKAEAELRALTKPIIPTNGGRNG